MKSYASNLMELVECVYRDALSKYTTDFSDLRDLKTIRSRVEQEGLSFLTITLPQFAKDFERSLADGRIDPNGFRSFKKAGAIPAFLQGMLSLLFDRETGDMYGPPETRHHHFAHSTIVECVRQVCLLFKKVELECAPQRVHRAICEFVQTEREFSTFLPDDNDRDSFSRVSNVLWNRMLGDILLSDLDPRHGPGATAEGISGNQKFSIRFWTHRLEPFFPICDSAYSVGIFSDPEEDEQLPLEARKGAHGQELENVTMVNEDDELPVRVVTVPKTLKAPRIIAIEPVCMQYAQQAIREVLYARIESATVSSGHVNFRDQSINQDIALTSSIDGRLATIDLKEASDRVPRDLALAMFNGNPDLRDAIDACRSTHAKLPDGTVIGPLQKFASMGSALCFPVEAMYFYTICVMAILDALSLPVSPWNTDQDKENVLIASRDVYVYGDDIAVPADKVEAVIDYLQKYNCRVNTAKSFWTGKFRESCGVDAYDGDMVTPIYIRSLPPDNRQQADRLISWVQTADAFYQKGMWRTSDYLYKVVEKHLGELPYVHETSAALGRKSFLRYRSIERYNRELMRPEVKAWVTEPVYRTDELDGYAALQKSLSALERANPSHSHELVNERLAELQLEPCKCRIDTLRATLTARDNFTLDITDRDKKHLERSARHGVAVLKRRWVSALY